jgi:hypothetical protein
MVNNTHTYLIARAPISTTGFSGAVTTASVSLNGPGGQSGNGFPLPRRGYLTGLQVWDGTTLRSDTAQIAFDAGDKISVYCQNDGSSFTVKVRVNASSTTLQVSGVPLNSTLFATVEFMLIRE